MHLYAIKQRNKKSMMHSMMTIACGRDSKRSWRWLVVTSGAVWFRECVRFTMAVALFVGALCLGEGDSEVVRFNFPCIISGTVGPHILEPMRSILVEVLCMIIHGNMWIYKYKVSGGQTRYTNSIYQMSGASDRSGGGDTL
jgi:hypothetical protein